MFGIFALPNVRYIGDRTTELRSGRGATNNGSICISPPTERCQETSERSSEDERRRLKFNREQTVRDRSDAPKYAERRASHLRGDLGDTIKLVRGRMWIF